MAWNKDRMLFNGQTKPISLDVTLECTICNKVENNACEAHDATVEQIDLVVKGIPWARLNYFKSQSVHFDEDRKTHFDTNYWVHSCLKEMIVEAPWGKTDDIFLIQVGNGLGSALEKIVPTAFGESHTVPTEESFSELKK